MGCLPRKHAKSQQFVTSPSGSSGGVCDQLPLHLDNRKTHAKTNIYSVCKDSLVWKGSRRFDGPLSQQDEEKQPQVVHCLDPAPQVSEDSNNSLPRLLFQFLNFCRFSKHSLDSLFRFSNVFRGACTWPSHWAPIWSGETASSRFLAKSCRDGRAVRLCTSDQSGRRGRIPELSESQS